MQPKVEKPGKTLDTSIFFREVMLPEKNWLLVKKTELEHILVTTNTFAFAEKRKMPTDASQMAKSTWYTKLPNIGVRDVVWENKVFGSRKLSTWWIRCNFSFWFLFLSLSLPRFLLASHRLRHHHRFVAFASCCHLCARIGIHCSSASCSPRYP